MFNDNEYTGLSELTSFSKLPHNGGFNTIIIILLFQNFDMLNVFNVHCMTHNGLQLCVVAD